MQTAMINHRRRMQLVYLGVTNAGRQRAVGPGAGGLYLHSYRGEGFGMGLKLRSRWQSCLAIGVFSIA